MYDFIVIGGGIAGSSIAYFLSKGGKSVAIIEKNKVASGASGAAGAFINPVIGKPSPLKELHDKAFAFTVEHLTRDFPHLYNQCGTLLLPKTEKSIEEFRAHEKFMDFRTSYLAPQELDFLTPKAARFGAYMCHDAGVIDPKRFCMELASRCDIYENRLADEIVKNDEAYEVCGIRGRAVIVATGANKELLHCDYLRYGMIGLWGQKIEVEGLPHLGCNISGEALVSVYRGDRFAIGATYTRSESELAVSDEASSELIEAANAIAEIDVKTILETKGGLRSTSIDHFPIVGEMVNNSAVLEKFPYIKTGFRPRTAQMERMSGLYIFTGHGSKGFTLGFYTAKLLCDSLLCGTPLDERIENSRIFIKWARKVNCN